MNKQEFKNEKGEIVYATEQSGSRLQIKDPNGKIQFEIEPTGKTLKIRDSKGSTIGSCEIEPRKVAEKA